MDVSSEKIDGSSELTRIKTFALSVYGYYTIPPIGVYDFCGAYGSAHFVFPPSFVAYLALCNEGKLYLYDFILGV